MHNHSAAIATTMENTSHPLDALSEETMPIISNNNASREENERKTSSECANGMTYCK
jgi:hypothetical protein